MPTHTVNFTAEQYNYVYTTSDDNEVSQRVRELVELGMAVEQSRFDESVPIVRNLHSEWNPDDSEALKHIIGQFVDQHGENNEQ